MKRKKLLTTCFSICFLSVLVTVPFVSECAAKTMTLAYDLWMPSKIAEYPLIEKHFKGLEDATGGEVKVEFHVGGSMGKGSGTYQRTLAGVADIGHFAPGYTPGVFPMFDVFMMPLRFKTAELLTRTIIPMMQTNYFDKEFSDVKIIGFKNNDYAALYSAEKKVSTIGDLKGLKIRTSSEGWNDVAKAFGAVPVGVPVGELYTMLQKRALDGTWIAWGAVRSFRLGEVCKYANKGPWMTNCHLIAMNKNVWKKLPKSGKEYLEANRAKFAMDLAKLQDGTTPKFQKMFRDKGGTITEFAPGSFDKADSLFAPIWKKWIDEREAKGLPAKKMLGQLEEIMTGLGIQNPIIGWSSK